MTGLEPLRLDVVSVQSQVVYGRVGNNAAVPTLEALGLAVAAVPTVLLSNTPHYPTLHGGAVPLDWFGGYLRDLSARGALHALRALVVGYLGEPAQAAVLAGWARTLLAERAGLRIVLDPVLGDHDTGVYVAPAWPKPAARTCCRWPAASRPTASSWRSSPACPWTTWTAWWPPRARCSPAARNGWR